VTIEDLEGQGITMRKLEFGISGPKHKKFRKTTMRKLYVNTYAYANERNPWAGAPLRQYI